MARFGFYAVANGRNTGIYSSWDECKKQVDGYANAKFKKFGTKNEALNFIREQDQLKVCTKVIQKKKPALKNNTEQKKIQKMLKVKEYDPLASTKSGDGYERNSAGLVVIGKKKRALKKGRKKEGRKIQKMLLKVEEYERRASTNSGDGYERNTAGVVVVYTDGGCSNNRYRPKALAGYGVFWNVDHPDNENGPVIGEQTNNRGEITAVIRAIEIAQKNGLDALCVRTDSQFLIDSMTKWVYGWRKNGWKTALGEPVKNIELMQKLDKLTRSIRVVYEKVSAHSGVYGNEMADRLATKAINKVKKAKKFS